MRATQCWCLGGEGFRAGRGNSHEWPGTYFDSGRLFTATSCTRGLIFDGMKHGTGKQFEEQSRYTKGIWKRNRLRREQRDCPALNCLWISCRDVHATEKDREALECHLYYIKEPSDHPIAYCCLGVNGEHGDDAYWNMFLWKMLQIKMLLDPYIPIKQT